MVLRLSSHGFAPVDRSGQKKSEGSQKEKVLPVFLDFGNKILACEQPTYYG